MTMIMICKVKHTDENGTSGDLGLEIENECFDVDFLAVCAGFELGGGLDGGRGGMSKKSEGDEKSQEAEETSEAKGLHGASVGVERV